MKTEKNLRLLLGKCQITQNYWVFGLFPSSVILGIIKHDGSETGYVSALRYGGEDIYSVGSFRQS
jgi:hypothetical protein